MRYIYLQESRFFWPARLRGPLDIRAGKDVLQGQGRIGVLGLQQHVTWRGQRVHPSFVTHDLSQVQIFKRVEGGWFEIFRHVHSKVDVGTLRSEESSGQHLRKEKWREKKENFQIKTLKKLPPHFMSSSGRGLLGELSSSRARVTPIKLRRRPLTWIHFPSLLLRLPVLLLLVLASLLWQAEHPRVRNFPSKTWQISHSTKKTNNFWLIFFC